ncbi:MAG: proteasome subunit beta [Nitrospinaceae bacterium]|nr:MAG: proteasome subunit beta [Nitrospinaceae bacterium]
MKSQEDPLHTSGDFFELLQKSGYRLHAHLKNYDGAGKVTVPNATTVLAFHFKDGVMMAGDRRATAGNSIMYERCDKVIPIDDYSLMAIAGVPATAFEMARILSHNFEYYRRSQMQSMSTEGKIRALSKLLKENVGMALQGVGAVSPIFATYDLRNKKPLIYFYDMLGADFRILTHCATGSGSPMIRGILEHEDLWGKKPLVERSESEATKLAIRLLQTAAQFDSATGQARPEDKLFPVISTVTEDGYRFIPEEDMPNIYQKSMSRG